MLVKKHKRDLSNHEPHPHLLSSPSRSISSLFSTSHTSPSSFHSFCLYFLCSMKLYNQQYSSLVSYFRVYLPFGGHQQKKIPSWRATSACVPRCALCTPHISSFVSWCPAFSFPPCPPSDVASRLIHALSTPTFHLSPCPHPHLPARPTHTHTYTFLSSLCTMSTSY